MNQSPKLSVPVWYWVIATVAVLWNLMGCAALAMELFAQEAMMESFTEPQKEWARSISGWIYFVYGVAVLAGVAGSVGLFLRKGWSVLLLAISLVAVLIQMVYTMVIAGGLQVMGAEGAIMPSLVIVLAAIFLLFSWFARAKGWIGNGKTLNSGVSA
ncbi:MAG: hypothetical protein WD847_21160 [Pirellulales bacterium]